MKDLQTRRFENLSRSAMLLLAMAVLLAMVGWLFGGLIGVTAVFAMAAFHYIWAPETTPERMLHRMGARPIHRHEVPWIHRALRELSQRAKLPRTPALYVLPSRVPQAFTTVGEGRSAIGITPGLLTLLEPKEVIAVLAHEISHLRHHDLVVLRIVEVVRNLTRTMSGVGLFLFFFSLPLWWVSGLQVSWFGIALLCMAPLLMNVLALALSRSRELDADVGSVALVGDPKPLANALRKLERFGRGSFWARWFGSGAPAWALTHPPTAERLRRLAEMRGGTTVVEVAGQVVEKPNARLIVPEWRRPIAPGAYVRVKYSP